MVIEGMEVCERRGRGHLSLWRRLLPLAALLVGGGFLAAAAATPATAFNLRREDHIMGLGFQLSAFVLILLRPSRTSLWIGWMLVAFWVGLAAYWLL